MFSKLRFASVAAVCGLLALATPTFAQEMETIPDHGDVVSMVCANVQLEGGGAWVVCDITYEDGHTTRVWTKAHYA